MFMQVLRPYDWAPRTKPKRIWLDGVQRGRYRYRNFQALLGRCRPHSNANPDRRPDDRPWTVDMISPTAAASAGCGPGGVRPRCRPTGYPDTRWPGPGLSVLPSTCRRSPTGRRRRHLPIDAVDTHGRVIYRRVHSARCFETRPEIPNDASEVRMARPNRSVPVVAALATTVHPVGAVRSSATCGSQCFGPCRRPVAVHVHPAEVDVSTVLTDPVLSPQCADHAKSVGRIARNSVRRGPNSCGLSIAKYAFGVQR